MHLQLAVNLLDVRRDRVAGDVQNGTDLCETHASGKKIENFGFSRRQGIRDGRPARRDGNDRLDSRLPTQGID